MKNGKITEKLFWICGKCGKEHKLKMLFCDECVAEHSDKHFYKNKFHEIEIPSRIKAVDWLIMIGAVCLMSLCFFNDIKLIAWLVLISIILIIIAFIRLLLCSTIKLWRRLIVLATTILFSPFVLIIISAFVLSFCRDKLRERANRVDKIALVEACFF